MRKFAIAAVVAAVPLMIAAPSFAAPSSVNYNLTVKPAKKSQAVVVTPTLAYTNPSPGEFVAPLQFTDLYLPAGFRLNTTYQSNRKNQCDSKKVAGTKNPTVDCPLTSLLGAGSASFTAVGTDPVTKVKSGIQADTVKINKVNAPASNRGVLIYNARTRTDVNRTDDDSTGIAPQCKGKPAFFIFTNALKPVQDQRVFPGCFVTIGGRAVIRVPVYQINVAGLLVSVTKFQASLKGFNSGTCPANKRWTSKSVTTFRKSDGKPGGPSYTANSAAVRCS